MTAVEARGIDKRFGPTHALRGVDLTLTAGRCLGLVGRNGAGKSTMVSVLSGQVRPDLGTVRFDGRDAPAAGAVHLWREQIGTVHQHSMLVPDLSVAENLFLGRLPGPRGPLRWRALRARAEEVLGEWSLDFDPRRPARDLTIEQRQLVEIARAMASGTRCLLLDEPTAALEHEAATRLFARVRQLVADGVAVLFISHHLEEVFDICDDVLVLRDGSEVLSAPTAQITREQLVAAMVSEAVGAAATSAAGSGEEPGSVLTSGLGPDAALPDIELPDTTLPELSLTGAAASRLPLLTLTSVSRKAPSGDVAEASLTVHAGELLGVVGLTSSGVVTLGQIAAGALRADSGEVLLSTPGAGPRVITRRDEAQRAGIGYVPDDRRAAGFVGVLSIAENIAMTVPEASGPQSRRAAGQQPGRAPDHPSEDPSEDPPRRARGPLRGLTTARRRAEVARPLAESLHIQASSLRQPVSELSGGNQQKVTVARALAGRPDVLVAITPTRGVDVASKDVLLGALRAAGRRGLGVLLATDDLDDLEICDRVLVLVRGRVTAEFDQTDTAGTPVDRAALIAAIEGISTEGTR